MLCNGRHGERWQVTESRVRIRQVCKGRDSWGLLRTGWAGMETRGLEVCDRVRQVGIGMIRIVRDR